MEPSFQTWKDVIETLIIPVALALIAYLWPEIQNANRRQKFLKLIIRELKELSPYPEKFQEGNSWCSHQTKHFIHKKIFDSPSENRDFILSLPPDMVYYVSQLWNAREQQNGKQWLEFLEKIAKSGHDKDGEINKEFEQWKNLIGQYEKLKSGD